MAGYIDDLVVTVTEPAVDDDPGTFPAQYADDKKKIQDSFPNVSGAVTATEADLNAVDVTTLGTAEVSKVVTTDANKDVTALRNVTATGTVTGGTLTDGTASITGGVASSLTLTSPVLNGTLSGTAFLDEDDLTSDSAIAAASQQSIKAYVDTALASVGTVRQIKVENAYTDQNLSTSWLTRDIVTLTGVQSGSHVLLFAICQFNCTLSTDKCYLAITDSSNTILCNSGNAQEQTVAAGQTETCMTMAHDSSPGTGNVEYRLRGRDSSGQTSTIQNATIAAIEFAP